MKNTLGKYSIGVGDRFAHQAKPQLKAVMIALESGCKVTPVWNKSYREHEIIGSQSIETRKAVDRAVKELNWDRPYFLDADHVSLGNVDFFIDTCNFYTIDVAEFIGLPIEANYQEDFFDKNKKFLGKLEIPGISPLKITSELIRSVASKYLYAVHQAKKIFDHIKSRLNGKDFVIEISMDETDKPQTPDELLFILSAISELDIPATTIAPKFSGRFNKGVEYVGDLNLFKKEFEENVAIIQFVKKELGLSEDLKLSVHSGSDKFSIYPLMSKIIRKYNSGLHLKTAGTSWLEELIGLAESEGKGLDIAKHIYSESYKHYNELCEPYLTVIDIDKSKLPTPSEVNGWKGDKFSNTLRHNRKHPEYNLNFRQLLHVGYKIAAKLDTKYLDLLKKNEGVISKNVTDNIYYRHLEPLFVEKH